MEVEAYASPEMRLAERGSVMIGFLKRMVRYYREHPSDLASLVLALTALVIAIAK